MASRPFNHDAWKTTPPDYFEPSSPECECGAETTHEGHGVYRCPECAAVYEPCEPPEPDEDELERVRGWFGR
jgi:tRNA(Ile2) C34 agmatinyltransferase TiaS